MKIEDVLPHLRSGGKVKLGITLYDLNMISNDLLTEELIDREDFEIVEYHYYKKEHIIDFESYTCYTVSNIKQNTFLATSLFDLFPNKTYTKYKVTIEEIVE